MSRCYRSQNGQHCPHVTGREILKTGEIEEVCCWCKELSFRRPEVVTVGGYHGPHAPGAVTIAPLNRENAAPEMK